MGLGALAKYMAPHHHPPPTTHLIVLPKTGGPPKLPKKVVFWAQFLFVSDQNSKEFLKNLKYFLGSGPIFEKKVCKKGVKRGVKTGVFGFWAYFTLFYPVLPCFTYFGPHLRVRPLIWGLRAKPRGLKAARRWDGG